MKLSDYSAFLPGLTYAPTDVKNDGLLVLRSSNIQNGQLSFLDNVYVDTEIVPNRIRTKEKDVLMCVRNGSKALVGKTALITSEYADLAWGAFMTVLRPKRHNTFLFQYLNSSSFKTQVFPDLDTATVKQITMGTLNGVHIYVPSLPEQEKIAFFLQWIDARIEKQHNLIETLKKYLRIKVIGQNTRFLILLILLPGIVIHKTKRKMVHFRSLYVRKQWQEATVICMTGRRY